MAGGGEAATQLGLDAGLRESVPALERWEASPLSGSEAARARLRRRYVLSGYRPEPLPSRKEPVESPAPKRVGICCSGGGIRSAAFNLGALQALQKEEVLQKARYLAAVSGGSYIAAAFATVRKSSPGGVGDESDAELLAEKPPFSPGSPEEQYVRNRCNYLAPDGISKLYLAWRIVLGLLFNVAFLALPLIGATMVLGATIYQHAFHALVSPPASCTAAAKAATATKPAVPAEFICNTVALPTWAWALPAILLGLGILTGLLIMVLRVRHDARRRAAETWTTRLLIAAGFVALLTIALPELVALLHPTQLTAPGKTSTHTASSLVKATGGGVAGLLVALGAHLRSLLASVEEDVKKATGAAGKFKALKPQLQRAFAYAVAAIVGPLLFYFVIVFAMSLTLTNAGTVVHRERLVMAGVGALLLSALIYCRIDITALSLHHFYKRRLCTAFALKRVLPRPIGSAPPGSSHAEAAHPRLAADRQEQSRGIAMERDYDRLTPLSETGADGGWPTLLVCAAANISDPGATPPGRHVTSFTFSPYSVGGPLVGAMATKEYEDVFDANRGRARDLTLPAAVAMSGAAVAPSMGKLTRRPLTFLLALGNVRLGVWMPNPRWVAATRGVKKEQLSWIPRWQPPRASYLLRELFGRNRIDGRYLFVTDGGHYENLGLVELLRRGCTEIYCFDASGGESFSELGDAIALARSELGVEFSIDPSPLKPTADTPAEAAGSPGSQAGAGGTTAAKPSASGPPAQQPGIVAMLIGPLRKLLASLVASIVGRFSSANSTSSKSAPVAAAVPASEAVNTSGPRERGMAKDSVVRAKFRYLPKDGAKPVDGVLYYARNVMSDSAPWDVRSRHLEDPKFPHDPTTDQLYTDQKFESYRALGERAGERALALTKAQPA